MPYDHELAEDMRALLADRNDVVEKPMFGGRAFMVSGHLAACAGHAGDLLVRVGPEAHGAARKRPGTSDFVMSGRVAKGWVRVDPATITSDEELAAWILQGVNFATSLPSKRAKQ